MRVKSILVLEDAAVRAGGGLRVVVVVVSEADSGASDPLARSIFIVASFPSGGTRAYAACVPSSWRATAAASVLLSVRPGAEAWLANDCAAVVGSVGSVGSAPSAPGAGPRERQPARATPRWRTARRATWSRPTTAARRPPRAPPWSRPARHRRHPHREPRSSDRRPPSKCLFLALRRARPRTERSRPRGSRSGSNRESDRSGARVDRDPRVSRLRRDALPLHRRTATAFPTTRAPQFDV